MQNFDFECIIKNYIDNLSGDSFKVLMKLISLAKSTTDNFKIRSNRALRKTIGINTVIADSIWNQLISYELVRKKVKQNRIIYMLNGTKICEDNNISCELRNLKIIVYNEQDEVDEKFETLADDRILLEIKKTFVNMDTESINELLKTIQLLRQYNLTKDKHFRLTDLKKIFAGIIKYDNSIIKEACYKYNSNGTIAGLRGYRYVLKIVEGTSDDLKNPNKNRKFAREGFRIVGGIEVKKTTADAPEKPKQLESSELKFARRLALGRVNDNIVYRKLLQHNTKKLVEFWNIGKKLLTDEGLQEKICSDYSWLSIN